MPEAISPNIISTLITQAAIQPLTPHRPGELYDPAVHGTSIKPHFDCSIIYDYDGGQFARFAERNGIPTGIAIPTCAKDLVSQAWAAEREPASVPWRNAERLARRNVLLEGARAVIAMEAIARFQAANDRLGTALRGFGDAIAEAQADLAKRAA